MISKYLNIIKEKEHKNLYRVVNSKGRFIGWISWYNSWRRFVFSTAVNYPEIRLDSQCMIDIAEFMEKIIKEA